MNKKVFLGLFATSAMMFGTACSSEDLIEQGGGNTATVSFTLSTEDAAQSRAYNDGTSATDLTYAFYDKDGKRLDDISGWETCNDLLTTGHTIDVKLVKGQTYKVVVFAQSPQAPYTITTGPSMFVLDVNYQGLYLDGNHNYNNDEVRDAFYKTYEFTVNGDESINLELTRPFAQINVGTTDYADAVAAGFDVVKSKVVIKNVANTFNMYTGEVSGSEEVTYEYAPFTQDETLSVDGQEYTWLSMCYVLPSEAEASTTVDAEFTFANAEETKTVVLADGLDNMPIQRNSRTNILGQLLTDDLNFVVKVDKNFKNPDHIIAPWDGETITAATRNGDTWEVATAAQWVWLATNSNYWSNMTATPNITLTQNIDFNGHSVPQFNFAGVLDGKGHTVSNALINGTNKALFTTEAVQGVSNVTVKNVTFKNAKLDWNIVAGSTINSGIVFDGIQNGITLNLEKVNVEGSTVKGVGKVSALVGFLANNTAANLTDCKVSDTQICNYSVNEESGHLATFVGRVNPNATLTFAGSNVASNVTIDGVYSPDRGAETIQPYYTIYNATSVVEGEDHVSGEVTITRTAMESFTEIRTAEELVAFANSFATNTGVEHAFEGQKFVLGADIDLAGINWTPMGQTGAAQFAGEFDGRGYTIKNLTINDNATDEYHAVGLFGWVSFGTIKNVNFVNASVKGHHNTAVVAGYVESGSVEGVTVDGAAVECTHATADACGDKVGAIVGFVNPNSATLKNSVAKNSTVKGCRGVGQLAGYASLADVVNYTAQNVTVVALDGCTDSKAGTYVGGFVGQYAETVITEINTAADLDAFAKSVNEIHHNYAGVTVTLAANIDFGGNKLMPIGLTSRSTFNGTFNGNGKTISNFTIDYVSTNSEPATGVFGWLYGTVKDLTVRDAHIFGNHNVGAVVGCVSRTGVVDNCHVYSTELECSHANDNACGDKCGAVVGMVTSDSQAKVVKCSANNSIVKACRDAGQVIGCAYNVNTIDRNTATNVTVSVLSGCDDADAGANVNQDLIGRYITL